MASLPGKIMQLCVYEFSPAIEYPVEGCTLGDCERAMLALLSVNGPASFTVEIVAKSPWNYRSVLNTLNRLERKGLVAHKSSGTRNNQKIWWVVAGAIPPTSGALQLVNREFR